MPPGLSQHRLLIRLRDFKFPYAAQNGMHYNMLIVDTITNDLLWLW